MKVLLYVCCVLAASVLLAVFGWRLADDVLALTKPDEEITITVPENATVADVSRELKEKGSSNMSGCSGFTACIPMRSAKFSPVRMNSIISMTITRWSTA